MKTRASLALAVLSLLSLAIYPGGDAAFAQGDTPPRTPIPISDCVQLQAMNNDLTASYVLMNDINCFVTVNWDAGAGFVPIGTQAMPFTGTFDGQNHKIFDLFIYMPSANDVGLFTVTTSTISNVGLVDVNIVGNAKVGALVGANSWGTISNAYATGRVTGGYYSVGGLVGWNYYATINNSYANVQVVGNDYVGGLTGLYYAYGPYGIITNSYATGSVTGPNCPGGLVGLNQSGIGIVVNSYWDTETTGQVSSISGTGKTTAEMKQRATFVGWDFANTWAINEGVSYPRLAWETPPTPPDTTPPVISVPDSVVAEATGGAGAVVAYTVTATDDVDGAVTATCTPASGSMFAIGATTVNCTATDTHGNTGRTAFTVTVKDTTAPAITSVVPSVKMLWPANHQMVPVQIGVSATDGVTAIPVCRVSDVRSNEPINGLGDGDTAPDWSLSGGLTVNLRAERAGGGNGRIYTLTVTCQDNAGNIATKATTVGVPKSQGK